MHADAPRCHARTQEEEDALRRKRIPAVWQVLKDNILTHRKRKVQDEDDIMICHCKPTWRGGDGCGPDCINRMLCIECVSVRHRRAYQWADGRGAGFWKRVVGLGWGGGSAATCERFRQSAGPCVSRRCRGLHLDSLESTLYALAASTTLALGARGRVSTACPPRPTFAGSGSNATQARRDQTSSSAVSAHNGPHPAHGSLEQAARVGFASPVAFAAISGSSISVQPGHRIGAGQGLPCPESGAGGIAYAAGVRASVVMEWATGIRGHTLAGRRRTRLVAERQCRALHTGHGQPTCVEGV